MATVVAKDSFGRRVGVLLKRLDRRLPWLADQIGESESTLRFLMKQPGWPKREPQFYARTALALKCEIREVWPDEIGLAFAPAGGKSDMSRQHEMPVDLLTRVETNAQNIERLAALVTEIAQKTAEDVAAIRKAAREREDKVER